MPQDLLIYILSFVFLQPWNPHQLMVMVSTSSWFSWQLLMKSRVWSQRLTTLDVEMVATLWFGMLSGSQVWVSSMYQQCCNGFFPWVRRRRSDCCCKGTTSGCHSSSALACRGFFVLVESWILNLRTTFSWGFESIWKLIFLFVGPATGTIALDPTFGNFTLLELVSHWVNWFLWWKCLDCLDWNGFFWHSECGQSR